MLSQRYALPWLQLQLSVVGWAIPPPELEGQGGSEPNQHSYFFVPSKGLRTSVAYSRARRREIESNDRTIKRDREIERENGGEEKGEYTKGWTREARWRKAVCTYTCVEGKRRERETKWELVYYTEGERGVDERRGNWKGAETRGRGGCILFFSTKLARDAWHGRRDARIREKSDGPFIIPVTIDARSRVTGLHGRRATDKGRTKTSGETFRLCCVAELTGGRHFGPRAVKKPCKWPNWDERWCMEDFTFIQILSLSLSNKDILLIVKYSLNKIPRDNVIVNGTIAKWFLSSKYFLL